MFVICLLIFALMMYSSGYYRGASSVKSAVLLPKNVGIIGVKTTGGPNKEAYVMLNNGEVILVARESQ